MQFETRIRKIWQKVFSKPSLKQSHSKRRLDIKHIYKQNIVEFLQNAVFNTKW